MVRAMKKIVKNKKKQKRIHANSDAEKGKGKKWEQYGYAN